MCEHAYKPYVNSNYSGFRLICVKCYKTQREIELEQQLAAANATITEQAATITELQTEIEYQNKQIARLQKDLSKWQVKEAQ